MNCKIDPFIRYIAKSTYFIPGKFLIAADCRMLYTVSGKASFETLNKVYSLSPGTLIYYPAGTPYKIRSEENEKFLFYTVNFDFSCDFTDILPMAPQIYQADKKYGILNTSSVICCDHFEDVVHLENSTWCEYELGRILSESLAKNEGYVEMQSAQMRMILVNIYRHILGGEEHSLCKSIKTILSEEPTLSNSEIAHKLHYHPFYINAVFKKHEGMTIHKYALKQKLTYAYNLVTTTHMSIDTIAVASGFATTAHFSTAFKEHYGASPSTLRKMQ
ncbi:MAG: helix-turn-helix domain-containing protein [Clostridia bacterium]|nr:helix-turn-helix domain-containing protein [Clostridia bacterium]